MEKYYKSLAIFPDNKLNGAQVRQLVQKPAEKQWEKNILVTSILTLSWTSPYFHMTAV